MSDYLIEMLVKVSESAPVVGLSLGAFAIFFKCKDKKGGEKMVSAEVCNSHVSELKNDLADTKKDIRKIAESVARIEGKLERRY